MNELEELYNELNELYKAWDLEYNKLDSLIDKSRMVGKKEACVEIQRLLIELMYDKDN